MNTYPKYQVKTTINVNLAPGTLSYAGNPGYQMNKPILMEKAGSAFSILKIMDASGNCVQAANSNSSSTVDILFGQNTVYSCIASDPCSNGLYIDQIAASSFSIKKWARGSDSTVAVAGTGPSVNTCQAQQIVINILYSTAGWVVDPQNYIIGAEITTKPAIESNWNRKYLKINWIYVYPNTISTPP